MMKTYTQQFGTSQKIIALAILGVFGPVHAADDDIAKLTKPESSISVGASAVSGNNTGDRAIFGQYNGMRDHKGALQLDIDYLRRDDASGTWTSLQGRNLGLDNRELGVAMQKQGDWKVTGAYSELVRRELRTINTADTGVGSTTPTIVRLAAPQTGNDVNLQLKRIGLGLGVEKWLAPSLQFEASFKNEDKDGARFWAKGYDCAAYVCGANTTLSTAASTAYQLANVKTALLMMAEPVNTNTKQFEMKFNFHDEKLNASAAYYGSFFKNSNGNVQGVVPNALNGGLGNLNPLYPITPNGVALAGGGMSLQNVLQLPMALPPDNQAHQFSIAGNYAFTPTTKATFKYAYTHATQDRSFSDMGLTGAPAGRSNLDGRVDTTLFQFGLTAKPIPKLSLLANLRYERKEDKTPNALYNVEARQIYPAPAAAVPFSYTNLSQTALGVPPASWDNNHVSNTKLNGKLEGSYQLPQNFRATVGLDYNSTERLVPGSWDEEVLAGLGPLREKNTETGYHLELRRAMSETLTGALGYSSSKRTGSDWTTLSVLDPTLEAATAANGNYKTAVNTATSTTASRAAAAAANVILINTYCGGRTCYGQQLSEGAILGLSSTTLFPMEMANLNREKWKLSANWTPVDKLSLQFRAEEGRDTNTSSADATAGGKGYRGTKLSFYNIDADYALTDSWKLNGYWSSGEQKLGINRSTDFDAILKNTNTAVGIGLLGKASGRLEIGANLAYLNDVNKYSLTSPTAATQLVYSTFPLPDVTFRQTTLSLFGKYALDKSADVRVSLVHQRSMLNEWAWGYNNVPFTYADNTTVGMKQQQNVTFIGAAYVYKFQ